MQHRFQVGQQVKVEIDGDSAIGIVTIVDEYGYCIHIVEGQIEECHYGSADDLWVLESEVSSFSS